MFMDLKTIYFANISTVLKLIYIISITLIKRNLEWLYEYENNNYNNNPEAVLLLK